MGDLTLEKLKVSERLEKLETSVVALDKTVSDVSNVLFGEKGADGVVHQLREINKLICAAKEIMSKIFLAILGLIGVSSFPYIAEFLARVTRHG